MAKFAFSEFNPWARSLGSLWFPTSNGSLRACLVVVVALPALLSNGDDDALYLMKRRKDASSFPDFTKIASEASPAAN